MILDEESSQNSLTSITCNLLLIALSKTHMHEINTDTRELIISVIQTSYCRLTSKHHNKLGKLLMLSRQCWYHREMLSHAKGLKPEQSCS